MPLKNTFGQDISKAGGSIVPQAPSISTINSTTLAPQAPIQLPTYPTLANGQATNASIPNPSGIVSTATGQPQSPQDIINANSPQTSTQATQDNLLAGITEKLKSFSSLDTRQIQNEQAAGVPGLQKTVNDLTAQLQGLNDQATKLQLDAAPGGTIENQQQLAATGRGITAGGLAPKTAAAMRQNQIQQNTIASQALTVKAAYYAANNNLVMAKDAADKAAQIAFDADQQDLNYRRSLLDAIQPQLQREEKKQSLLIQAQLDERTRILENQQDDYKTGQALAIAALKLNPNDPTAQYNAQQAMKLDPHDPQYLQKVTALVGQYQKDPLATQQAMLDMQIQRANLSRIYADIKLTDAQRAKVISDATPMPQTDVKQQLQNNEALTLAKQLRADDAPGKKSAVGASLAKLVPFGQALGFQGNRTAFDSKVQSLKSMLTLDNLKLLKGAMSDKDLIFLNSIGTSLDTNMSETQFNTELDRVINKLSDAGATANDLPQKVQSQGYDYNKMRADGYSDADIRKALNL